MMKILFFNKRMKKSISNFLIITLGLSLIVFKVSTTEQGGVFKTSPTPYPVGDFPEYYGESGYSNPLD